MARIPLVDPDDPDIGPDARELLGARTGASGEVMNVLRAMANHPRAFREGVMVAYRPGALITPVERELAYLSASVVNTCHY
jgi:hypothetical protein